MTNDPKHERGTVLTPDGSGVRHRIRQRLRDEDNNERWYQVVISDEGTQLVPESRYDNWGRYDGQ